MLMALRVKGETTDEIAGGARALRRAMITLPADEPDALVDTCGTGGGRVPTFNISTAAALLAAGAGVRVAKHGNRSFTTSCGSADVLEALGVRIELAVEEMERVLREAGEHLKERFGVYFSTLQIEEHCLSSEQGAEDIDISRRQGP